MRAVHHKQEVSSCFPILSRKKLYFEKMTVSMSSVIERGNESGVQEAVEEGRQERICLLLSWVPGTVLGNYFSGAAASSSSTPRSLPRCLSNSQLHRLGETFGKVTAGLQQLSPPTMQDNESTLPAPASSSFQCTPPKVLGDWDILSAYEIVKSNLSRMSVEKKLLMKPFLSLYEREVMPRINCLRRAWIHSDLNEYNVTLISSSSTSSSSSSSLTASPSELSATPSEGGYEFGILDYGDLTFSLAVADVAIAAAYIALLYPYDALRAMQFIVQGNRVFRWR